MRKSDVEQVLNFIKLFEEAHEEIKKATALKKYENVKTILVDCQDGAIALGTMIEQLEGEGHATIQLLEKYCEIAFHVYQEISSGVEVSANKIYKILNQHLVRICNSISHDIVIKREIVILPYKASMWDSLESIWIKLSNEQDCDVYVIPIPYYDKNPNGTFREMHFEGDLFPEYVPIIHYDNYDFEKNRPDEIYIHNPYDQNNFVTSVAPFFYSSSIKKFTEKLVYIPYFVLGEVDPEKQEELDAIKHFVTVPAVMNADLVILQSEAMKTCYVKILTDLAGKETQEFWEHKISGEGSPKFDKIEKIRKEDLEIPYKWQKILNSLDGHTKKVILYNVSIASLLNYDERMLLKIRKVHEFFKNRNDVVLLWRPHPLLKATMESMRPNLVKEFDEIVEQYKLEEYGIYDDTPDLSRAIILCDGYYGDSSSLVQLCQKVKKPIMIQNVELENEV